MDPVTWWNNLKRDQKLSILTPLGIGEIMVDTKLIYDLYSKHSIYTGICAVPKVPGKGSAY